MFSLQKIVLDEESRHIYGILQKIVLDEESRHIYGIVQYIIRNTQYQYAIHNIYL